LERGCTAKSENPELQKNDRMLKIFIYTGQKRELPIWRRLWGDRPRKRSHGKKLGKPFIWIRKNGDVIGPSALL